MGQGQRRGALLGIWLTCAFCDGRQESERSLRLAVEEDLCGLHKILDDVSLAKADLEAQQESLKEEQLCLKSNHEQVWSYSCRLHGEGRVLGREGSTSHQGSPGLESGLRWQQDKGLIWA